MFTVCIALFFYSSDVHAYDLRCKQETRAQAKQEIELCVAANPGAPGYIPGFAACEPIVDRKGRLVMEYSDVVSP